MDKREFYKMVDPSVYWEDIQRLNLNPQTDLGGVLSGWSGLDQLWGAKKGEATLVYGAPNMGKTTWLLHLAVAYARINKWRFVLWMPEDFSTQHIIRKLIAIITGKPVQLLTKAELVKAMEFINRYFKFYETSKSGVDWKNWKSAIDHWLEMEVDFGGNGWKPDAFIFDHALMFDKTESFHEDNVKFMMNNFNDMAKDLNVHNFIVNHIAQPKLYFDRETHAEYLVPQMPSKMAHGQMWERLAQNIIEVFRPKGAIFDAQAGEVWINIHKVKNEDVGTAGRCKLYYDKPNSKFQDTWI